MGSSAKKFLLVDTPGHGKLRRFAMARLGVSDSSTAPAASKQLRAVVFVVDAAALAETDGLAAAASYLYDVLLVLQKRASGSSGKKSSSPTPVLIAANKLDLFTALPAVLVRSQLESELARIRRTRSKGLLDSGVGVDDTGADESDDWLGEYGSEKFSFSQMAEFDIEVDVLGGNIIGEGPGVDPWWKWIADKI
jgi:signal recognition particle receptor subunit beta